MNSLDSGHWIQLQPLPTPHPITCTKEHTDLIHNQGCGGKGGENGVSSPVYAFTTFEVWCWTLKSLPSSTVQGDHYGPHKGCREG